MWSGKKEEILTHTRNAKEENKKKKQTNQNPYIW